jgi:hypothetical protein
LRSPARRAAFVLVALASVTAIGASAWGASGSGTAYAGAGNSWQQLSWNNSTERLQIRVRADEAMSTDRCIDGHEDWNTNGTGHYDSRVVRVCEPGVIHFTDPDGDYWFDEPTGQFNDRNITGMQRGAGYKIDDDTLEIIGSPDFVWGGPGIYSGGNAPVTTAGVDMWAKLWTHYQSGQEVNKDAKPATCAFPASDPRC